ncbi:hypothetical protein P3S67_007850 [Capsicum chacoense]
MAKSRPIKTFSPRKRSTLMETAQEMLRERLQRKDAFKYHINRLHSSITSTGLVLEDLTLSIIRAADSEFQEDG